MGAFSLLLASCPAAPCQITPSQRNANVLGANPGKQLRTGRGLKNAGCSLARLSPVRVHSSKNTIEDPSSESVLQENAAFLKGFVRVLGLGVVFAVFTALGAQRAFTSSAIAAPVATTETQLEEQEEIDEEKEEEIVKKILEIYGLDKRFKEFVDKQPERLKEYRELLGIEDVLKEVSKVGENDPKLHEIIEEGKKRLKIESRRLQGRILLESNRYLNKLSKEENSLMEQLDKIIEDIPGAQEALQKNDLDDPQVQLFYSKTEELRQKITNVKADLLGSEYENWMKAWHEIPTYTAQFEAEINQLAAKSQKAEVDSSIEYKIGSELSETGKRIWEESVLPLAMNSKQQENVVGVDSKVKNDVDNMLRNHIQYAGEDKRRALAAIKEKLGSVELYAGFSGNMWEGDSLDIPGPEMVKTMLGWKKWCLIKREELKERFLQNPELGKQYFQQKQEKLLLARDRVLEKTWYNEKSKRLEMSDEAALYAVEKNLVHHVRIRHDFRIFLLALKGETREYAVNIKDMDELMEDEGGFDGFYAKLKENRVPTVVEKMWIPLREWTFLQLARLPFILAWDILKFVWNMELVRTARELYMDSLMGVVEELMVRFGHPLIQKLPRPVRVFLGFDLPKGSEFLEPTFLMKWQKRAQEKFDVREISLPWWMDLPLRVYVVGVPLAFISSWVAGVLFSIFGPRPLPLTQYGKTLKLKKKVYKEMAPLLKQLTTNPIKRVFDKMKRIRRPEVPLKDFVGIESFKEEVDEVVSFLRDPGAFKKLGARPPRGVLIVGETGTGKTTLARAIASEARVPVVELQSFDVQGGGEWVGQKAANVRELFKTARQFAPIILFMDNFHEFVGKRGESASHNTQELESLINQFLVELDGFETQEGVVVLATTAYPDRIDEALRRPGRMDRTINLLPPNRAQREKMLRLLAEKQMRPHIREWVNWAEVSEKVEGYTFVDLQYLPWSLQQCATHWKTKDDEELKAYFHLLKWYDFFVPKWLMRTPFMQKIDQGIVDFLGLRITKEEMQMTVKYMDAYGRSKPGIELHDPMYEWTPTSKHPHAIWAAGRGLVAMLLPNFDIVELLWLDETSWEGIAWTRLTKRTEEGYLETGTQTRSYLEKKLVVCYGSYVADRMLLPHMERTDLWKGQHEEAQEIASNMVMEYGWALDDSPMVYRSQGEGPMSMGYEEIGVLSDKVKKLLDLACDRAAQILEQNKAILETFVDHLVEHEFITQETMEQIVKEKGGIFEKEPFTLMVQQVDVAAQSTNGNLTTAATL